MLIMPDLLYFGGNWDLYIETVYNEFRRTFILGKIRFRGLPVSLRSSPEYKGKEFGFWHLTSEGKQEEDRTPDFERCARINWISHMIINHSAEGISCWKEKRDNITEIVIWNEAENYVVILSERRDYWLLKTAYVVTQSGKRRQLRNSRARNEAL
ncbi:oxidoreductase [Cronobacter universalis]|nr:oxidoreductase [Cronobacter universalis]